MSTSIPSTSNGVSHTEAPHLLKRPVGVGKSSANITRSVVIKLIIFAFGVALVPILVYFYSLDYFEGSSTKSAISAAITANLILFGYIFVAYLEDQPKEKRD
jgi:uncharacterized membrane protein